MSTTPVTTPLTTSARRKLRLAVLVSGSGRTLQNFIDLQRADEVGGEEEVAPWEVALVIGSKYGLGGVDRAMAADIPHAVVERNRFDEVAAFSETVFRLCDGARADLVLLAGWLCLLRIPALYDGRVMNIHPSLLPAFGGKGMFGHHVHEAVLKTGCRVSGCTVHFVDNEYDAGPIIAQATCPVLDDDTAESLAARVFAEENRAYPAAVRAFAGGRLQIRGRRVVGTAGHV